MAPGESPSTASAAVPDAEAFRRCYEENAGKLHSYLLRMTRNPDVADDLVQEAFLRAWKGRERFQGASSFKTWVFAIGTNLTREHFRKKAVRKTAELPAEEHLCDTAPGPGQRAGRDEKLALLRAALEELPSQLRAPLELVRFQEMSYAEAGEALGITTNAVRMRVHRAHVLLEKRLRDCGVEEA